MRRLPLLLLAACAPDPAPAPPPPDLAAHCRDAIGEPRVEEPSPGVFVAIGWDLANTILITTDAGHVLVDAGMHPSRAAPVREALLTRAPGSIAAIVYTHSHIDHVGGASVWAEPDTEVWATDRFTDHFFKQYGVYLPAESARAARQFGLEVPLEEVPCSALGRRVDLEGALRSGVVLPTRTFSGETTLHIGGREIRLVEAHGETDDQLFVWLPDAQTLLPGDNWYRAFPNLYTVRGTRPRPVDRWIASLDAMRALDPAVLIPSHTRPVLGRSEVRRELRDYRDGISWVRSAVVRGANAGLTIEQVVQDAALPPHLAGVASLKPLYGQVDWSARAIYGSELGWFDGQARRLYPLPEAERARRLVEAMGGREAVLQQARSADEPRWAAELLGVLEALPAPPDVDADLADAYEAIAATVPNSNGRSYLLQSAKERREGPRSLGRPQPAGDFVAAVPLEHLFEILAARLKPEDAQVEESVVFDLGEARFVLTLRHGVAELVRGDPLPGTPEPLAVVHTDGETWRRLALKVATAPAVIAAGKLRVEGSSTGFLRFLSRFERDLNPLPSVRP